MRMHTQPSFIKPDSVAQAAALLLAQARAGNQRRVLLLAGERDWAHEQARSLLDAVGLAATTGWLGNSAPEGVAPVAPSKVSQLLGRELPALVVDAFAGFDPDAVGAAIGALAGGGLLLLLTPPLEEWPAYPDPERERIAVAPEGVAAVGGRFLARLVRLLRHSGDVYRVEQGLPLPALETPVAAAKAGRIALPYATDDQREAVEAVLRVVAGHRRRPLVLLADRGRGKSAAFGIAAAMLLRAGKRQVVLTGPRRDALQAVFEHAARLLPDARRHGDSLVLGEGRLRFVAPDALAEDTPAADVVLVDEAAAVPVPLLGRLLQIYPRIAFATTVHGYEGTGRGFMLRFRRQLDEHTPGWRLLRLETPVRWAPDDPLERLGFRMLLLDAEAAPDAAAASVSVDAPRFERLDRDALAVDESLLSELFGLLMQAHYRTRPFDLRHMLDGANVQVYVQRSGSSVVGAALVAVEGGLDPAIGEAVFRGERRLRGHLIPQSLAFHLGMPAAVGVRCARIVRLAVHPGCRGKGLGRAMVAAIAGAATDQGLDLLGSSFGGTDELLRFWRYCGLSPVRVGVTREASSGEHSLMVLRALNDSGAKVCDHARSRFLRNLPDQLTQTLSGLEPVLALQLLRGVEPENRPDAGDLREVSAFAFAQRGYDDTIGPLRRFVVDVVARQRLLERLTVPQQSLIAAKVLQGRSWSDLVRRGGFNGRTDAMRFMRRAIASLLPGDMDSKSRGSV